MVAISRIRELKVMVLFADMALTDLAKNKPFLKTFTCAHNESYTPGLG